MCATPDDNRSSIDRCALAKRFSPPIACSSSSISTANPAVPPPGQFAIYNALAGPKELYVLGAGHFDHAGTATDEARLLDALAYFFNRD